MPGSPPFLSTLQSTEKRQRTSTARFQAAVFVPASVLFSPSCGGIDMGRTGTTPEQGVPGKRGPTLKLLSVPSSVLQLTINTEDTATATTSSMLLQPCFHPFLLENFLFVRGCSPALGNWLQRLVQVCRSESLASSCWAGQVPRLPILK